MRRKCISCVNVSEHAAHEMMRFSNIDLWLESTWSRCPRRSTLKSRKKTIRLETKDSTINHDKSNNIMKQKYQDKDTETTSQRHRNNKTKTPDQMAKATGAMLMDANGDLREVTPAPSASNVRCGMQPLHVPFLKRSSYYSCKPFYFVLT